MQTFIQAKYSDVQDGVVFFFETDEKKAYPKRKRGAGHHDIRDNVSASCGCADWVVFIPQTSAQPKRQADGLD